MTGCLTRFFSPPSFYILFSFVRYRFASAQTRATTSSRIGRKSFAHAKVHAAQLGMQMFRDRCIVKGGEILFGRTKCKRWLDALGRFARIFPVERSIARVLSSGNGPGAKMIHVFFCGETRSVISFNLYVSLDNWQSWEIKGRLTNSIRLRRKMMAIFTSLSSNCLDLGRRFHFYFSLQNSFRSTVDRGIHGQVPLGG